MANFMSSILDADPRGMNSMIAYASDPKLHHRTHRWDFIEATMSHWNRIVSNRFRPRDEVHQWSTRSHSLDAISLKPCAFESVFFMMRYEWCFHDASSKIWCLEKERIGRSSALWRRVWNRISMQHLIKYSDDRFNDISSPLYAWYIIILRCLRLNVVSNSYLALLAFVMANLMSSIQNADPGGMKSMFASELCACRRQEASINQRSFRWWSHILCAMSWKPHAL